MTNEERDNMLVEMHTDLKLLRKDFENHLQHHFRYSFYAWTATIGVVITLITMLIVN